MSTIVRPGFLRKLREPVIAEQLPAAEQTIAIARSSLAAASLVAIYLDPTEPQAYASLAYALMVGYFVYSIIVQIALRRSAGINPGVHPALHAVDILWTAVIMTVTEGPNSAFFLFFVFTVIFAAYRWDLRRTVITATVTILLMLLEAALLAGVIGTIHLAGEFEMNRLMMRVVYIFLAGFLVGYVADREKALRGESLSISRIIGRVQATAGLRKAICSAFEEIFPLLDANEAWIVVRNLQARENGGLWKCTRVAAHNTAFTVWNELDSSELEKYHFNVTYSAWHAVRPRPQESFQVVALDRNGEHATHVESGFANTIPMPPACIRYVAVDVHLGEDWAGRIIILNPIVGADTAAALRFLRSLAGQMSPGMHNAYLISRIRSRIGAIERSRIARELHDGVIQSMISLELETAALRLRAEENPVAVVGNLRHLQERMKQEILTLREIMEQMRPAESNGKPLLQSIQEQVDRFQRRTGIHAEFVSNVQRIDVAPNVSKELAKIVQEGLVNVRKHSGATEVRVRVIGRDESHLDLVIEDNGHGFKVMQKPAIINERAGIIGGEVAVESQADKGSRLTVTFPVKGQVNG